jgi:hypothetical protein
VLRSDSTRRSAIGANGLRATALLTLGLLAAACSKTPPVEVSELDMDEPADEGAAAGMGGSLPDFPDTGINAKALTVTGIIPGSGPFTGGNAAIVRGSGFTAEALVFIGGNMVQPADTLLEDRNSLRVIVPAGRVGAADVAVQVGNDEATRPDAYVYSPLLVEPVTGSIAGGTSVLVTIDGVSFDEDVRIDFGGTPCTDLRVVAPHQVRCKTPPGSVGPADVRAYWPDDETVTEYLAARAFEYMDLTDTDHGGLSGGPVEGTLNVTVVDSMAGFAVPNAFVLVGDDPDGAYQGRTNARGQITFSGPDLEGPVTVHVIATCMERASIVAFDAENVTLHVTPLLDPSCGMPGDPPPAGRGTAGSLISGELIFPGSNEFAVNAWDVVPPPRAEEVRVTYVFTTRVHVGAPNPSPAVSGTTARVLEETSPIGTRGYPYRIFARPAGLAVYALSGLERRDTGEFIPYVMGVARDVLTAPGAETTGIDIHMNIPLDHELQAAFAQLPDATPRGPTQFRVQAHIDLGGEGVIVRQVNGQSLDTLTSFTGGSLLRFFAQPALIGTLADTRYQVIAGWYSGDNDNAPPYTELRRVGVAQTPEPVSIDDLLAIPSASVPPAGARIPSDRVLRWDMADPQPDLYVVEIIGGDGLPAWMQIVPGTQTETTIPDLSSVEGIDDIAAGIIPWIVRAIRIEDFDYDQFKYNTLSPRFWTHTSVDTFTMQR